MRGTFKTAVVNNSYIIKNHLLLIPAEWMIENKTSKAIKTSIPSIMKFAKDEGTKDFNKPIKKLLPILDIVKSPLPEIYTIPMFTESFCDMLLDEIKNMEEYLGFTTNEEEDKFRQIPEIVLQNEIKDMYISFMKIVFEKFNPIFQSLWQRDVSGGGIQIANYNPRTIQQTSWHHDFSADISVVVPLNTGSYKGGGTEFFNKGIIDPLPKGHALMFPSFTHMHRGMPVKKGDRYLLVFWLTIDENERKAHRLY